MVSIALGRLLHYLVIQVLMDRKVRIETFTEEEKDIWMR